ncbi:MAG TPA: Fe-S cluster assembly protein SufD [Acidimicrobiia bacterium]|nr:Fe-S cluster assembly protein SufD [Acidimicrobiia bacterium]
MTTAFTADVSRALDGPQWLIDRRLAALERLRDVSWPTAAEEIWRYSRIDDLDLERYRPVPFEVLGPPGVERAPGGGPWAAEAGRHAGMIVVHDGRVVHHELDPQLEARGVKVCGIATCEADVVQDTLGVASGASEDAFTVLHDAFLAGGAFISVPPGVVVDEPIVVLHWCDGDGLATFPHTLVVAGEGSQVTVLDRFGTPDTDHLVDAVVELLVHDNAHVRYLSIQEHGRRTWHLGLQRAHIGRDATLRSSAVALGGDYARLRSESLLQGQGAESDQLAVYFGDGNQMLDFRTLQDHDAPHTRSDLLFKGAVEDTARSVYSGLIHLRPTAVRAEAYQTNRNLVLTEGAGAESIPNLVIETDDVRCSHASTVGPIDDDQQYYLESRGIPPEEAERLIVLGFFDDVFTRLPVASSITERLRGAVIDKIERGIRSGVAS